MRAPIVLLSALALALAACSANPVPEAPEPTDSFVYGHIDMEDAPTDLDWVSIRQYAPPTDKPYYSAGVVDGTFYNWYLDPGSYAVDSFGGIGGRVRYTFNIPRQNDSMRLVIKQPGIYFLGSFRYKNVKTGFFEPGKYNLEPSDTPSEREILERLIKLVKGTVVEPKLQQRLKELK